MFLGEIFQTQTIDGWHNPSHKKIDHTQPGSNFFDPNPSLVRAKILTAREESAVSGSESFLKNQIFHFFSWRVKEISSSQVKNTRVSAGSAPYLL